MSNRSRLEISKKDIISVFENSNKKAYSESDLTGILLEHSDFWRLGQNITTGKLIEFLIKKRILNIAKLKSERGDIVRYYRGDDFLYEIALSIRSRSYLSHYTAVFFYGLTDQIPKTIYVNYEQSRKNTGNVSLKQKGIDDAFKKPVRVSHNIYSCSDHNICVLNGKHTGHLGVCELKDPSLSNLKVTDIERTLIDIAVRPVYAGGIYEVQQAFKRALEQVSVNKLTALLKKINYIYPYHQVIGFYLDRAGCKQKLLDLLVELGMDYDFYLTHQMGKTSYSKKWRLFYPKDF
ncbi:MAG: hypothetical protein KAI43_13655 [Candidatus Aureabacteria bacterium]|nr:hypothetical protein [Candidatus Auribacterota bacterium]